jgi:zinc protease
MLDRKTAPPIHDAIEFDYTLPPINSTTLSNGTPLYWLSGGVQEVVQVDWVFPAGLWHEPHPGIAQAVAGLLKNGTRTRTAHQVNEALEFYGASLKVGAGNDNSTVTLYTLTKHLPHLLPIVQEVLTEATFPQDELAIYQQNTIQRLLVHQRQCEFVANQQIDVFLFGEAHPYGRYTKKETIEAITRQQLQDFYKTAYNPAGATIFMAGLVGDKEVALLNEMFGKEPRVSLADVETVFATAPETDRIHDIQNDPNGVQAAIRIGRTFPNRHHADFAPMVVLNTIFGGYFGSRLMSNIREEKGYTYGIYSSLSPFVNGGALTIHTEVGRDVARPAVEEIYKEMQLLCEEAVDEEELLLVKNYLLGNLLGDLDGPFSILQRWRTLIVNGMTVEHFNRNIEIYKNITAEELQALANKYFRTEDYKEVVVV